MEPNPENFRLQIVWLTSVRANRWISLLRGHGSSSLHHSKFFMPKNSIEARWNSAMSWGGKDRTGVDPELL